MGAGIAPCLAVPSGNAIVVEHEVTIALHCGEIAAATVTSARAAPVDWTSDSAPDRSTGTVFNEISVSLKN